MRWCAKSHDAGYRVSLAALSAISMHGIDDYLTLEHALRPAFFHFLSKRELAEHHKATNLNSHYS